MEGQGDTDVIVAQPYFTGLVFRIRLLIVEKVVDKFREAIGLARDPIEAVQGCSIEFLHFDQLG